MLRTILATLLLPAAELLNAQAIRGDVKDAESLIGLPGATVVVVGSDPVIGTVTDAEGRFALTGLPPGRIALRVRMIGYEEQMLSGLVLTSAKDLSLTVRLQGALTELGEVEITGDAAPGQARNEMALLSARQFSVEETDRYAGSRGDPGRILRVLTEISPRVSVDEKNLVVDKDDAAAYGVAHAPAIVVPQRAAGGK